MDVEHLGIIGHSAGSDGALVTAGVDPQHRFKAAVALDDYGIPPSRWRPTVPTMIQQTELQGSYGPYTSRPPADWFPSSDLYKRFAAAKTPRALLALAGSDHNDFSYLPEQLADPTLLGVLASRYGERTSTYYARAWLDRFLKADRLGGGRVIGSTFDAIIDPLSRGQGSYDVVRQQNVPYRLKGLRASDQLSPLILSAADLDGHHCTNLQRTSHC